jgi:glutaredoxin 2
VSSSFKRLQAEKFAVDNVLQELTPLQSIRDSAGLREYIENMSSQVEVSVFTFVI